MKNDSALTEAEALEIFGKANAIVTNGHFIYTSGKHGSAYVNKDAIYPHTHLISNLCAGLAERFKDDDIETIVGPAIGGVILSQWVATHLSTLTGRSVHAVYAERVEGEFIIKRGYPAFVTGKRILVVEDIVTTGLSARETIEAVRKIGGEVVAFGALCNRGGVESGPLGNPPRTSYLINLVMDSWDTSECPMCKAGKEVNTSLGHGAKFLAEKKKA